MTNEKTIKISSAYLLDIILNYLAIDVSENMEILGAYYDYKNKCLYIVIRTDE